MEVVIFCVLFQICVLISLKLFYVNYPCINQVRIRPNLSKLL